MAIFNNTAFTPVIEQDEDYIVSQYPNIMPTSESAWEIAAEGYQDIHKLLAGVYVSDIMIEQSVMTESADAEALTEATVSDFVKKAVDKFVEIKNKIIAWFKKVLDNLKVRFTSSSKFVATYEKQILAKAKVVSGYKPNRHTINEDVEGIVGGAIKKVADFAKSNAANKKGEAVEDFGEKMIKHIDSKATDFNSLKKTLRGKIISDTTTDAPVTEAIAKSMVEYCKKVSDQLKAIETIKKDNIKAIDGFITDIQTSGKDVAIVHPLVANYNKATSLIQQLNTVATSAVNAINSEYVGILRGLMVKKVKEAYDGSELMEESATNTIFETALEMI